jgi:hypothetical protein
MVHATLFLLMAIGMKREEQKTVSLKIKYGRLLPFR